jgi:hypothetical protein
MEIRRKERKKEGRKRDAEENTGTEIEIDKMEKKCE